MSQLLAPAQTVTDKIPLWLRIREIMKEKGNFYSLTAMAGRLGMSRETLRLMLSGEREIYSFELEKIAMDLKVPLPRLLQAEADFIDSKKKIIDLVTQGLWTEALKVMKKRKQVSIGLSERAVNFSIEGFIYTWKKDLEETKRCNEQMLVLAKEIHARYGHDDLMVRAFQNLLNTLTLMRDTDSAAELIEVAEPFFQSKPLDMGTIYFFKARIHLERYERAAAKDCLYKSLELTLQDTNADQIARSYYNVAWAEYADCNYLTAKEYLERSIEAADLDMTKYFSMFKLAKTLFKLKEDRQAVDVIHECLAAEQLASNVEMQGKLLILLTRITKDHQYAERAALSLNFPQRIRFLAYRYLSILIRYKRVRQRKTRAAQKSIGQLPKRRFPLDLNF